MEALLFVFVWKMGTGSAYRGPEQYTAASAKHSCCWLVTEMKHSSSAVSVPLQDTVAMTGRVGWRGLLKARSGEPRHSCLQATMDALRPQPLSAQTAPHEDWPRKRAWMVPAMTPMSVPGK